MELTLYEALHNAQNEDNEAVCFIIEKFKRLIKKHAYQLNYYCAKTDLVIAILELIQTIDLDRMRAAHEGELVNYFVKILYHKKIDLHRQNLKYIMEQLHFNPEIFISEFSYEPQDLSFFWTSALNELPYKQRFVIVQKYLYSFTDVEIASQFGISRQAANRLKNRALKTLKDYYKDNIMLELLREEQTLNEVAAKY
ncbi:MAG: sigma-70 family RNA polymerase sigma factor [Syntrophomonadaceae bacterium]|nr:sigma-70 family RNA polymerase sigma factor [Syntrophomonadaceae bacterium]